MKNYNSHILFIFLIIIFGCGLLIGLVVSSPIEYITEEKIVYNDLKFNIGDSVWFFERDGDNSDYILLDNNTIIIEEDKWTGGIIGHIRIWGDQDVMYYVNGCGYQEEKLSSEKDSTITLYNSYKKQIEELYIKLNKLNYSKGE